MWPVLGYREPETLDDGLRDALIWLQGRSWRPVGRALLDCGVHQFPLRHSHKRAAQSKVAQMIVPGVGANVGKEGSSKKRVRKLSSLTVPLLCPDFDCH